MSKLEVAEPPEEGLEKVLHREGFESEHLDSLVHDAASRLASNANNGGMNGQLEFLQGICGWTREEICIALDV